MSYLVPITIDEAKERGFSRVWVPKTKLNHGKKKRDIRALIDKHFGAIPDFPEVHKKRYLRRKSIDW